MLVKRQAKMFESESEEEEGLNSRNISEDSVDINRNEVRTLINKIKWTKNEIHRF